MKNSIVRTFCALVFSLNFVLTANASPVFLDSMLIATDIHDPGGFSSTFGFINFPGTMTVPAGVPIDYFEVEITALDIQQEYGNPNNTVLEFIDLSAPSNPTTYEDMIFLGGANDGQIAIGDKLIADGTTKVLSGSNQIIVRDGMFDIFMAYVNGPGLSIPPWQAINKIGYNFSKNGIDMHLEFTVSAFTDSSNLPSAVPVPAAVWLFGSGLLGLIGVARHKKRN